MIPFLKHEFGASDQTVGLAFGCFSLGSVAGSLVAGRTHWPFGRALGRSRTCSTAWSGCRSSGRTRWSLAVGAVTICAGCGAYEITSIVAWRMRVIPARHGRPRVRRDPPAGLGRDGSGLDPGRRRRRPLGPRVVMGSRAARFCCWRSTSWAPARYYRSGAKPGILKAHDRLDLTRTRSRRRNARRGAGPRPERRAARRALVHRAAERALPVLERLPRARAWSSRRNSARA